MSTEDSNTYTRINLNYFKTFKFPYKTTYYLYNTSDEPNTWSILTLEEILKKQINFDLDKMKYHSIRIQCVDDCFNMLGCYKFAY